MGSHAVTQFNEPSCIYDHDGGVIKLGGTPADPFTHSTSRHEAPPVAKWADYDPEHNRRELACDIACSIYSESGRGGRARDGRETAALTTLRCAAS